MSMYSVVLMVAMAGGAETPALFNNSCQGCCGYSCSGYSCNGCCGYSSCHGCKGWSMFGGKSCHGCCGSSSCHGCCGYTSCHGCCGYSSCHGCCGGKSRSLFGGKGCHGCHGCHGCCGYTSCHGCCGYTSCYGCNGCCGTVVVPTTPPVDAGKTIEKEKIGEPKKAIEKGKTEAAAPARIIVSLPADARLTVDGVATTSVSARRVFVSPELVPGKAYSYTLKAEFSKDGKSVVVTKEVIIKAGAEISVNLVEANAVASR
jgi:uncharacterized protein (TIGR03000 family)